MDCKFDNSEIYLKERASRIYLNEKTHTYFLDGKPLKYSVSQLVNNKLFPIFDNETVVNTIINSKNWKNSKYYPKDKATIIKEWEILGERESKLGTNLHKSIELYYKNNNSNIDNSIEFKYFLNFVKDHNYIPYQSEYIIFDEDKNLAGCVDMLYKKDENNNTDLILFDWKRCKSISKTNSFSSGNYPLTKYPNSNYWKYTIQLNLYKKILELKYNKSIIKMFLLVLHPNNENYKLYEIPSLDEEIDLIYNDIN